jgi:S-DNA-T family DNA segregation ATPase FtsK/SpoIIIE
MKSTAHNTFGIVGQPITAGQTLSNPLQPSLGSNGNGNVMARNGFTPQYGGGSPNGNAPKAAPKQAAEGNARTPKQTSTPKNQAPESPNAHKPSGNSLRNPNGNPLGNPMGNPQVQGIIAFCAQYKRELGALALALCGAVLLWAMLSYSPEDRANARISVAAQTPPTPSNATTRTTPQTEEYVIHNWLGYVGASVSHFVYNYTVGYAALAFPLLMFVWAAAILRRSFSDRLLLGTALGLVGTAIVASFAGVLQLVPWMPTMRPEWSGSVGQFIARMLWQVIGTVGAFIVLTIGLVATLFTALDLNIEKTIARFKDEKSRFGSWQAKKKTDIATSVRESMNDDPIQSANSFNTSNDEVFALHNDNSEMNEVLDNAMFGTVTEAPKSMSYIPDAYIPDDEVLSAKAAKTNAAKPSSLADDEEPARVLRRTAEHEQPLSSIRRDLIAKYSDNELGANEAGTNASANAPNHAYGTELLVHNQTATAHENLFSKNPFNASNDEASEVLSAHGAKNVPALPTSRTNTSFSNNTPNVSVSAPQTTVNVPNFAYPSQASITFVEKKNSDGEGRDESEGIRDEASIHEPFVAPMVAAPVISAPLVAAPFASEEESLAERRNAQHLTGLMAEQVAGEVAEKVAHNIAENVAYDVALDVARRIARQVAEEIAGTMLAKVTSNVTANITDAVMVQMREEMQAQMAEQVEEQVNKRVAEQLEEQKIAESTLLKDNLLEKTAFRADVDTFPETRTNARPSNVLNVVAKPMFLPQNILDEELNYLPPHLDLLVPQEEVDQVNEAELQENARLLTEKLKTFRIEIENLSVTPGPVVTQYEFVPAAGIKVAQIGNLTDDIALALKARGIRIIAPVPGRGTVAVEIPNHKATAVRFSSIVATDNFQDDTKRLPLALGKTINGEVYTADLAKMPHLLIAGATGSGKSVGINSIIASLLYKMHPRDLKFVIIDPKKVEMTQYRALANHFLAVSPDIDEKIITNPQNAVLALKSVVAEMERRYDVLAKVGQRNIVDYNAKVREGKYRDTSEVVHHELPYIVVIVDELADLMMTASKDVEEPICRLAQLARAVGIHLIVATQRPSVDVVTGLIKANFPARIAYQVSSKIDSRTILDSNGAEHLLGNGDMLFTPGGAGKPMRLQNSYLSTDEVERICDHISNQQGYSQPYFLPSVSEKSSKGGSGASGGNDRDELFEEAARIIVRHQQCSVSLLQRRMKIGYSRAARVVDQLEEAGVVGPFDGSKGRLILIASEADLDGIL